MLVAHCWGISLFSHSALQCIHCNMHVDTFQILLGWTFRKWEFLKLSFILRRINFQSLVRCGLAGLLRYQFSAELNGRRKFKWKWKFYRLIVLFVLFSWKIISAWLGLVDESTCNKCLRKYFWASEDQWESSSNCLIWCSRRWGWITAVVADQNSLSPSTSQLPGAHRPSFRTKFWINFLSNFGPQFW